MRDSETASFGLAQIGQIAVPVSDIERAVAFYRDTLGMHFLFQAPPGLGFFDCAGVRLMLDAPAKALADKDGLLPRSGRKPSRAYERGAAVMLGGAAQLPVAADGVPPLLIAAQALV